MPPGRRGLIRISLSQQGFKHLSIGLDAVPLRLQPHLLQFIVEAVDLRDIR
jgi:hypothetical protein